MRTYTASLLRPFARLLCKVFLPPFVFILSRKPWVLFFFILCGRNVVYVPMIFLDPKYNPEEGAKSRTLSLLEVLSPEFLKSVRSCWYNGVSLRHRNGAALRRRVINILILPVSEIIALAGKLSVEGGIGAIAAADARTGLNVLIHLHDHHPCSRAVISAAVFTYGSVIGTRRRSALKDDSGKTLKNLRRPQICLCRGNLRGQIE